MFLPLTVPRRYSYFHPTFICMSYALSCFSVTGQFCISCLFICLFCLCFYGDCGLCVRHILLDLVLSFTCVSPVWSVFHLLQLQSEDTIYLRLVYSGDCGINLRLVHLKPVYIPSCVFAIDRSKAVLLFSPKFYVYVLCPVLFFCNWSILYLMFV